MSYEIKFRKRTIEYVEAGHTFRETAKVFRISTNTLNAWVKQYRETESIERKYRTYKTKVSKSALETYIANVPDAYQHEMAQQFACSQSTVCRRLKRYHITRKKR